ncbi:hypothetical protein [Phenylobacterium montanum]|uniref:Uncharacterized protein n=1 Tax=Phenylobacterium montanum TaxID=2823693 RepID=A0A975FY31_9CAUL|nr:hypothetical protein [Caulobacter sp. S6]QUD86963.1 hypothetical protein KCG34_18070 [Caulobacter sp. S6]
MNAATETRRKVMLTAHLLRREGRQLGDGRNWSDCLRWAWREVKHQAAKAAAAALRMVRLSPSLIRSPIERAVSAQRFGRRADFHAAHMTARLGG